MVDGLCGCQVHCWYVDRSRLYREVDFSTAEQDYFLSDPGMEIKHGFKLSEALERAGELKKRRKKLLEGHFFYFTPNVPVDHSLLKSVLKSLGAEVRNTEHDLLTLLVDICVHDREKTLPQLHVV
jgi:hypothetical protein